MEEVRYLRRCLHQIPEIAFNEEKTKKFIKSFVSNEANNFVLISSSKGGLVYYKAGKGKNILWRSEMDGLPLSDNKQVPYSSLHEGMCHSCGHDAHMAILLKAMKNLNNQETSNLYCVFQSAEEVFGGGKFIVKALNKMNIKIDAAFSLHIDPSQKSGMILSRPGNILASNLTYYFDILMNGSHIANGSAEIEILNSLTAFIKNYESKDIKISISRIKDNGYLNISPSKLNFSITVRCISSQAKCFEVMEKIIVLLKSQLRIKRMQIAKLPQYPIMSNSYSLSRVLEHECIRQKIPYRVAYASFSSDDFAYYREISKRYLYLFLGCQQEGEDNYCHTELFDINEECLISGVKICQTILQNKSVIYN